MREPRRRRESGAALILVVVVIAALLAIAAPFVVSMRLHEASSRRFAAETRARQVARAARNLAVARLRETHPDEERRRREAEARSADTDEDWDDFDELSRRPQELPGDLAGLSPLRTAADDDTLATVRVADARARIEVNTCGPHAIANLLGVTVSTRVLSFDETDALEVEDTSMFFSDGDPETIDGLIRIDGEEILYRHTTPTRFVGLTRGVNFTRMRRPEKGEVRRNYHPAGSLVQDARGFKIALDPTWRYVGTEREGRLARFENPLALRRIADWELASQRAAWFLFGRGLDMKGLRRLGIDRDAVEEAGLEVEDFDRSEPDRSGESAEQRRARTKAERALRKWGLSVEAIRRRGGDAGVVRLYELLASVSQAQREKLVKVYRNRLARRAEGWRRLTAWQRKELSRQFAVLSEVREFAPQTETLGRVEFEEKLRPYVTTSALPEGEAWSDPQVVNNSLLYAPHALGSTLVVQDARRFRAGAVVRVHPLPRADGVRLPDEFRYVFAVQTTRQGDAVRIFPQLDGDYLPSTVEVSARLPRPVNVNSASREVLRAVLTGLQSGGRQRRRVRGGQAPTFVTPAQAAAIADAIVETSAETPLRGPQDLRALLERLLKDGVIDAHAVDAVYRNALDPCDPLLARSTVPFCYRSGDVYEVAATGIVNDPAGGELARHTFVDVLRVAPPRDLTWHVDSQFDFVDRLFVGLPGARRVTGGGAAIFLHGRQQFLTQTRPVVLGPYTPTPWGLPSRSHAKGQGDIQPLLSQLPTLGRGNSGTDGAGLRPGALRIERFDGRPEGAPLAAITLAPSLLPSRWVTLAPNVHHRALGPGSLRAWYRFDRLPRGSAKAYLFDGGEADSVNRVSLYLQDGELVLALHDEALDLVETGDRPRAQELRYRPPRPFEEGNWYHVAAFWKGTEPGDLALAVDGRFVGGRPSIGTRLTQAIDATQTSITVEDASGFPPRGWLRIGPPHLASGNGSGPERGVAGTDRDANALCEVLAYDRIQGNTIYLRSAPVLPQGAALAGAPRQARMPGPGVPRHPAPRIGVDQPVRLPDRGSGVLYRLRWRQPGAGGGSAQGTTWALLGFPHQAGTLVVPYGYQARVLRDGQGAGGSPYSDVVHEGGASLAEALPPNMPVTVLYQPSPGWPPLPGNPNPPPPPQVVDAQGARIPVLWAGPYPDPPVAVPDQRPPPPQGAPALAPAPTNVVGGFPPRGIVRICSLNPSVVPPQTNVELVYYRRITKLGDQYYLDGCERGLFGTAPAPHYWGGTVVLESIELDADPTGKYPPRASLSEPRVYVSLAQPDRSPGAAPGARRAEWISYLQPDAGVRTARLDGRHFLLVPSRDTLLPPTVGPPPHPQGFVGPSVVAGYLLAILQAGGGAARPGDPGNWVLDLSAPPFDFRQDPNFMQPLKEILKRERLNQSRAQKGTRRMESPRPRPPAAPLPTDPDPGHPRGTKVVPTFALRPGEGLPPIRIGSTRQGAPLWFDPGLAEVGPGDLVTIVDDAAAAPKREERRVVHVARSAFWAPTAQDLARGRLPDRATGWLVAFDDFVSREYRGDRNARLARWPTGNVNVVPSLVFGRARDPSDATDLVADAPGTLGGVCDDLVCEQGREELLSPFAALAPSDAVLQSVANARAYQGGALLLCDSGEVLGVLDAKPPVRPGLPAEFQLLRGALGSSPSSQPLSPESRLWRLSWPSVAVATGPIGGARGRDLPVRRSRNVFHAPPAGGYLAVDPGGGAPYAELLPYTQFRTVRGGGSFLRPQDRFGRGAFRSAFGSGRASIGPETLLVDHPYRGHDRYAPRTSSLEGVYFQCARELPGSLIVSVDWEEHLPSPYAEVKVALRVDGAPSWDAPPARAPGQRGRLYLFDDPRGPNEVFVSGDRVELRVYMTFKPGAFENDAWKRAPIVGALRVHYRQATAVLRREERLE
ncbi:MAG: hypothetical protein D6731_12730 [Planctomycetota bacterium]|nr:MAG: hypothetical protein D6731_12730 [Planctomycetota bacterium]